MRFIGIGNGWGRPVDLDTDEEICDAEHYMVRTPPNEFWVSLCKEIEHQPFMTFGGVSYNKLEFSLDRDAAVVCETCRGLYMESDLADRFDGQIVPPDFQTPETEYWMKEHGIGKHA